MSTAPERPSIEPVPLPESIRAKGNNDRRVLIGLVGSEREALMQAAAATRLLDSLGVHIRIFVMPPSGTGKLQDWSNELRQAGGIALWILVTTSFEIVHRAAALELNLPLFCQAVGPNAAAIEKTLLLRITEISAAMLPAGRMREAAITFATMAALHDDEIASRLDTIRNSAATVAAKNSDFITTKIHEVPVAAPVPVSKPKQIAPEDREVLERSEAAMLKPRLGTKTERAKQPRARKALDYSMQLREVLNSAKEIAAAYRNPQIAPEHLLAAIIDTPEAGAHQVLDEMGINLETLAGHLMPHFPPPHDAEVSGMFSMADNTWTVLENARSAARERQRPCLTTLDFLESIALRTSSGATAALWETGLLAAQLSEAISEYDAMQEYESVKSTPDEPIPTGVDPDEVRELQAKLEKKTEAAAAVSQPQGFSPEPAPEPQVLRCSADNPEIETVEMVADALLEGRLVAFPIDVMYALVADATNPAAVERLRDAIKSDESRHLGALIHSTTQLKHLVKNVSPAVLSMLDELWPGPLTVVFDRNPNRFAHLSSEPTLGLRIPNDFLSLAILSTAGRPLAATSIRLDEGEGAKQLAQALKGVVDIVVDTGEPVPDVTTTVVSVSGDGKRLRRKGAAPVEMIETHLGKFV